MYWLLSEDMLRNRVKVIIGRLPGEPVCSLSSGAEVRYSTTRDESRLGVVHTRFLYAFYSYVRVLLFCSRHFPCIFVFLVCCYYLIGGRSFTPVVRFWRTLIVALGDPPRWAIVDLVLWAGWVTVRNGWWFGRHRVSDRRDGGGCPRE